MKSGCGLCFYGGGKIILILLLVFTLVGVSSYLVLPVVGIDMVDNTIDIIFGDLDWFSRVDRRLGFVGYDANLSLNLPKENSGLYADILITSEASGYGSGENERADLDFTIAAADVSQTFGLYFDENNLAIRGLDAMEEDAAILLPRKDIVEALDGSVFHPESGSELALDKESYDALCNLFNDDDESVYEELREVFDEICERSAEHMDIDSSFWFAEGDFALQRTVVTTLDGEDIAKIIDIAIEEIRDSESISTLIEQSEVNLDEIGDGLKEDFKDAEIISTQVYKHNAISNAKIVIKTKNGEYDEALKLTFDLEARDNGCLATIVFSSESMTADGMVNDVLEITVDKAVDDSLTEISVDISLKNHGAEEQKSRITLDYDNESLEYIAELTVYANDVSSSIGFFGKFEKYKNNSGFSFSLKNYTLNGQEMLNGSSDFLSISVKENPEARKISCPEGKALLSMTEEEIKELADNISTKRLGELYQEIIGQDMPLSEEGIMVLDPMAVQTAELIVPLYQNYRKNCTYYSLPFASKIRFYLQSSNLYILAKYNSGSIEIKYYYSPNKSLLNEYHPAKIVNGEIAVHDYTLVEEQVADCLNDGYKRWQCNLCQQEYISDRVHSLWHISAWKKIAFTYDVGKTDEDASLAYCIRCGVIQSIFFDRSYMGSTYSADINFQGSGAVSVSDGVKHLILPEELYERYGLQDMTIKYNKEPSLLSIRVPNGRQVIAKGDFNLATNLQVIALPDSLTEIEDGAFYAESDLHTIFYEGTEEEWSRVKLNGYETEWADVEIIFLPNGVDALTIMEACIDTDRLDHSLNDKKALTADINAAENLSASSDGVELVYNGLVSLAAYDALTNTVLVAEVGESNTVIKLLTPDGQVKSTIEIADVISIMDSDGGLLAMGSSSLSTIYLYDIKGGELSSFVFEKYECTFDHLYVDGGMVLFIADCVDTTEEALYKLIPDGRCEKIERIIGHEEVFFFREYHTIISTDWVNDKIKVYDTANGELLKTIYSVIVSENALLTRGYMYAYYTHSDSDSAYSYFDVSMNETDVRPESLWQELTFDGNTIEIQPILSSVRGRAAMILDAYGNISLALACEDSDTTVIDYYAEAGFITSDGDVILYTPSGYGLILICTK